MATTSAASVLLWNCMTSREKSVLKAVAREIFFNVLHVAAESLMLLVYRTEGPWPMRELASEACRAKVKALKSPLRVSSTLLSQRS